MGLFDGFLLSSDELLAKGIEYCRQGNFLDAVFYVLKALDKDEKNADAWAYYGFFEYKGIDPFKKNEEEGLRIIDMARSLGSKVAFPELEDSHKTTVERKLDPSEIPFEAIASFKNITCPSCHRECRTDALFCGNCGKPIK